MSDQDASDRAEPTNLESIADFVAVLSSHMRTHGLTSLDIEIPEARIRLKTTAKHSSGQTEDTPIAVHVEPDDESTPESTPEEFTYIEAPMIGTFYAAPGPNEPPFVEVGDTIEVGQTIAIIEAMKIMNEIVADQAGTIAEILVRNAEAVEFGQPLFKLVPAGGS